MLTGLGHHLKSHPVMLKKTLLALICLPLSLTGTAAQLTATLQSGDNVTPFYGANALVEAHNAAVNGDIITLSPGIFNKVDITKSITIIGSYGFGDDTSKCSQLATSSSTTYIKADNVTLEGIRAYCIGIKGADNVNICRSEITYLSDSENGEKKYHDNTILTDCLIRRHDAMSLSKNMVIRNCCVNHFEDCNQSANLALIENCNIPIFHQYDYGSVKQPYAIYRNCFLGLFKLTGGTVTPTLSFSSPTELHDIYFYQNFFYSSTSSNTISYSITYGSCSRSGIHNLSTARKYNVLSDSGVYQYGSFQSTTYNNVVFGPKDHKSYPATPSITSSQIDTETDAEGKLHVKISATARD